MQAANTNLNTVMLIKQIEIFNYKLGNLNVGKLKCRVQLNSESRFLYIDFFPINRKCFIMVTGNIQLVF